MAKSKTVKSDTSDIRQLAQDIGKTVDHTLPSGIGYFVVLHDFREQNQKVNNLRTAEDPLAGLKEFFGGDMDDDMDDNGPFPIAPLAPTQTAVATNMGTTRDSAILEETGVELDQGLTPEVKTGKTPEAAV
jgi:hypothetical protein